MKAIVTGSFDPITIGHLEIIKKIALDYEKVYVVALINENKEYMFSLEQRKELIHKSISSIPNAIADAYGGLTVEYMHEKGISIIILYLLLLLNVMFHIVSFQQVKHLQLLK